MIIDSLAPWSHRLTDFMELGNIESLVFLLVKRVNEFYCDVGTIGLFKFEKPKNLILPMKEHRHLLSGKAFAHRTPSVL